MVDGLTWWPKYTDGTSCPAPKWNNGTMYDKSKTKFDSMVQRWLQARWLANPGKDDAQNCDISF